MSEQGIFALPQEARSSATGAVATSGSPTLVAGGVGQQLRAAREARGASLAEVALSLKLGLRQVEALENEEWQ
ncbi:MAG TPA: hypothetical protein DGC76_11045, partial [Candidatus Accumulibacter sp.]|nr:hypothetical protein [Accumulibacter sp.]